MQHLIELAYLGVEVPDAATVSTFLGDVIGLMPGEATPGGSATFRNDARAQRIVVTEGPRNDATAIGFEVATGEVLDATVARLRGLGLVMTEGTEAEAAERRVTRLARTTAPWGVAVELVTSLAEAAEPFASPLVPGGFLTEGVGFGHVVFATTAVDEAHAFLVDGLGLAQSDWLEMELGPGMVLEVRFYHCNERHHSVALARAPFELPQALHHVMVETRDRDDVGAAFDRAYATDLAIPNGLGRHDNDGMFSFYVQGPAGWQVEVGHGGREITDPWGDDRAYDRISLWGHQPVTRR